MGIEYELRVPVSAREKASRVLSNELAPLLERLDPKTHEPFPNLYVQQIPEGLYVCDNLTNSTVAALVMRELIDILLRCSPEVSVVEP
jgi:hypothetical protein